MFEIKITVDGKSEKYLVDRFPITISYSPTVLVTIAEWDQPNIQVSYIDTCQGACGKCAIGHEYG